MESEQFKLQLAKRAYDSANIGTLISKRVSIKRTVEYWYSDILTCIKPDAEWDRIKNHFLPLDGLLYPYHSKNLLILKGLMELEVYKTSPSYVTLPEIYGPDNFKPNVMMVIKKDNLGEYYTVEYLPEMVLFYDKLYGKGLISQMGGYAIAADHFMEEIGLHGDMRLCIVTIKPDMINQEELRLLPTALE